MKNKRDPKTSRKIPGKKESDTLCSVHRLCQGCRYLHQDYTESLRHKHREGLAVLEGASLLRGTVVHPPQPSPKILGYRTHAKLAVRPMKHCLNPSRKGRFAIGLFHPASHQIVAIGPCPLQHQAINDLVASLTKILNDAQLEPYDEEKGCGDLRYLAIRLSYPDARLMLTFVMHEDGHDTVLHQLVEDLVAMGHRIASAHVNINTDNTNVIFGAASRCIYGNDTLTMRLCDLTFELGPTSFFQINPRIANMIYQCVVGHAGKPCDNGVAWDLYCGIGQLSLLLAQAGYRVLGVEANPKAIQDAMQTATQNRISPAPCYKALRAEELAGQVAPWAAKPELIVANPTRKGLSELVTSLIGETWGHGGTCRMIYISCEVRSLASDLVLLCSGAQRLLELRAFDMFPFTEKLEWLALIG